MDVPAVEAEVPCGTGHHTLRWDAGRLVTPSHPDPDGEAVLSALGGEEPECLRLRRAWGAHSGDPRLLVLGSRHPGDELHLSLADVQQLRDLPGPFRPGRAGRGQAGFRPPAAGGYVPLTGSHSVAWGGSAGTTARFRRPGGPRRMDPSQGPAMYRPPWLDDKQWESHVELLSLLALDARLQRRLQAHVASDLYGRPDRSARAALEAATIGRLRPVLDRWAPGRSRSVTVTVGEKPGVDEGLSVTVRPDWLITVWCRYLSLVDGFLVLDVPRRVPGRVEVTAASAVPGAPLARLTVSGPAPWRVVARD
jgi:hypothetical protein